MKYKGQVKDYTMIRSLSSHNRAVSPDKPLTNQQIIMKLQDLNNDMVRMNKKIQKNKIRTAQA